MAKLFRSPGFWVGMIVTIASLVYIWQTLQGEALSEFWANLGKGQYGWLLVVSPCRRSR